MTHIKISNLLLLFLITLVCSFATACNDKTSTKAIPFQTYLPMSIGQKNFNAQIAIEAMEKMQGLMNRTSLGENEGMFFIYDSPQRVQFWMKNTLIPLDIAFFDANGTLLEIKPLYPRNLNTVPSSSDKVMFCLEMNQGWFAKNDIKVGAKLDIKKLKNAIESRTKK